MNACIRLSILPTLISPPVIHVQTHLLAYLDSPTPPAVRSATSEPCVGHPLQPRTAEKAQEDSPDLNGMYICE